MRRHARAVRLFVALDLPWVLRERLCGLEGGLKAARWQPPENHHLTLRFLGELPRYRAEEADAALASVQARGFDLVLRGVGVFAKSGRPASLWAGVERDPALDHLQARIETALQRAGLEPERRRFSPHVTLGRIHNSSPDELAGWIAAHNLFRAEPVPVTHFTLFSSRLGKEQSAYTPEVEYALA